MVDVVKAFEKVSGKHIPYSIESRCAGDIFEYFANPTYAKEILDWVAEKNLT